MEDCKSFTVVIVTYNRLNLLKECLECVERQTALVTGIVVVNNASTDGTKEYLDSEKKNLKQYYIIHEQINCGGAGGFSLGVESAKKMRGEWVLLIDDDAMLNEKYLQKIAEAIEKFPQCKAFSGRVVTNGVIDLTHRRKRNKRDGINMINVPEEEYEKEFFCLDAGSFCGLVIKKELIEKIGIPIKEFFIWNDDLEYSLRIRKYSEIYNINAAYLNHKTNLFQQRKSKKYLWKDYYGFRNFYFICKKYGYQKEMKKEYFKERLRLIYWRMQKKVDSEIYRYNLQLLLKARRDAMQGNLGISEIYHS